MSDRFTARRVGLRRRRWFRILVAVLAVVVAALVAWLVWFSSVLAVRSVEVDGLTTLTAAQVRTVADVSTGEPLARADLTAIESRVEQMPRVRSAEVSRSWPRTVRIEVEERTAVMWSEEGGEIHGIDRYGVDFRTYRKEPKGLVEARIDALDAEVRLETTRAAAEVAELLRTSKPRWARQVQAITGGSQDSITLDLSKGRTVVWGSPAQGERKLEVLESLLTIDARGYDVSAPDQPTTKD